MAKGIRAKPKTKLGILRVILAKIQEFFGFFLIKMLVNGQRFCARAYKCIRKYVRVRRAVNHGFAERKSVAYVIDI